MDLADLLMLLAAAFVITAAALVSTPLAFLVAGLTCAGAAGFLVWGSE